MADPSGDRIHEYHPDHRALQIEALVRRIHAECDRRILDAYPVSRQLQMIALAAVVHLPGLTIDERKFAETETIALRGFVRCVTRHRLAADLLIRAVRKPGADLSKINPAEPAWWQSEDRA